MRRLLLITAIFSVLFAQTYDSEIQPIWDANCTSCHGNSGNLDLSQGVSYSNIVNVASSGYSGFLLVKPNDPMNSVIHQKIVGNSAFGERMPKNAPTLSASDESKIKKWIDEGALQSWSGGMTEGINVSYKSSDNFGGKVRIGYVPQGNDPNYWTSVTHKWPLADHSFPGDYTAKVWNNNINDGEAHLIVFVDSNNDDQWDNATEYGAISQVFQVTNKQGNAGTLTLMKGGGGGGGGTSNTIEIVARLNQNIGNGDVHVGVWLPGNNANPDLVDNKDNQSTPSPTEGWGFQLSDSRITPSTGPYKVEVFFDQNNNDMPDANEPYVTFNLNTDNQGYAFQDIEMFSGGGGTGDNLYVNLSVNDVPDGINGQMFIEVVRMEQAGQTIIKTFQFGEVTPIQNKHMDLFVEGMNNGENAFIYAQFDDENGEVLAEGESTPFNWPPNNDIDVILEPAQYSGPFITNITVNGTEDSGSLSFRIFPEGTIIKDELPDLMGAFYGYDHSEIYSSPPNNEEISINDFLMGIPFGNYPMIIWYDVGLDQAFEASSDPIVAGIVNINNSQTASFVGGPLNILPGPVIQGGALMNLTVNEGEDLTITVNVSKGNNSLAGEVDMVDLIYSFGDGIYGNIFCNNLSPGVYECEVPSNYVTNRGLVVGVDASTPTTKPLFVT